MTEKHWLHMQYTLKVKTPYETPETRNRLIPTTRMDKSTGKHELSNNRITHLTVPCHELDLKITEPCLGGVI